MAERIMAALDYLDAHHSFIAPKQKHHRPLGDIDSKYEIDPFDLPLHELLNDHVVLAGTSRTNLSREKTIDEIVDEDREKLVRNAQRVSSAGFHKNIVFSRPQTSVSSGSAVVNGDHRRRSFKASSPAGSSTASRTSTKKITFTPPGVNVGPTDARDEVMQEIVNKPLTHTPAKSRNNPGMRSRTATSAPVLGQQHRVNAVGCRSVTSLRRSKTSYGSSKQGEQQKKFETKPGPFTTIKVTGPDMWVVSSSTPTTYFNGDLPEHHTTRGSVSTKQTSWEDTANSVPREEKKSPPRYQRQLGAAPQFGPTHQWYSFAGGGPTKQRPVLTAFADNEDDEYYSMESAVGQKVAALLEGNPGIRIGVNGEIVAQSMKVNKKQSDRSGSESGDSVEEIEENVKRVTETSTIDGETNNACDKLEKDHQLESNSEDDQPRKDPNSTEENILNGENDDKHFSLLRYLGIAKGENPYVVESFSDTTSSTDVASILNFHKETKNGSIIKFSEQEETIWKILEGASPTLWIDKNKWKKMQTKMREKMAPEIEDGGGPLSWNHQLQHQNEKVLKPRTKQNTDNINSNMNGRTPVVYHKFVDYDKLPTNFVHLTTNGYQPHSNVSAVDTDLDRSIPSKGYQYSVSERPKTSNSIPNKAAPTANEKFPPRPFTIQPFVKPDRMDDDDDATKSAGVEVSDIMQLSAVGDNAIIAAKTANEQQSSIVNSPKPDDVTDEELEAIRLEAASKMMMTGGSAEESESIFTQLKSNQPDLKKNEAEESLQSLAARKTVTEKSVTLSSLPVKSGGLLATVDIRPSKPRSSMPVSSLNLSEMEEHYNIINGPNPTPSHSARPNKAEDIIEIQEKISGILKSKSGNEAPLNTPKTPLLHSVFGKEESVSSNPKHHNLRSPSSATTSRIMTDFPTSRINRSPKSASFASRSSTAVSPRNNFHQSNNNPSRQVPSRGSEGFVGSSLTSKPPSRNSSRFIGGSIRSTKTSKPGSSVIPHGNTYADLITKSGFIQISQPIHFSQHHKLASGGTGSGNKMYDSYMRELTSRSENSSDKPDVAAQKSGTLIGKRLGGTSGKPLPEYLRKARNQQSDARISKLRGHSSFTAFSGRRSGLVITNEQARFGIPHTPIHDTDIGEIDLGLQGGQLRLNLDKNIHVIYKDLGIPKKSSKPSSVAVSRQNSRTNLPNQLGFAVSSDKARSIGQRSNSAKSRPHSAKSERIHRKPVTDTDNTIPLANTKIPTIAATNNQMQSQSENLKLDLSDSAPDSKASSETVDAKPIPTNPTETMTISRQQSRSSSTKSKSSTQLLSEVVDSGTQWSPHEPLEAQASKQCKVDSLPKPVSVHEIEAEITTEVDAAELRSGENKSDAVGKSVKNDAFESNTPESDFETNEKNVGKIHSVTENLQTLENEKEQPAEISEDQEIRGVTKVTVNIATSG